MPSVNSRAPMSCNVPPGSTTKLPGWDIELSEPKRAFIVPAKCKAAARHEKTRGIGMLRDRQCPLRKRPESCSFGLGGQIVISGDPCFACPLFCLKPPGPGGREVQGNPRRPLWHVEVQPLLHWPNHQRLCRQCKPLIRVS